MCEKLGFCAFLVKAIFFFEAKAFFKGRGEVFKYLGDFLKIDPAF